MISCYWRNRHPAKRLTCVATVMTLVNIATFFDPGKLHEAQAQAKDQTTKQVLTQGHSATSSPEFLTHPIFPLRPKGAASGSKIMQKISSLSLKQRENLLTAEILKGNVPEFLRHPKKISISEWIDGKQIKGKLWTLPDYLAVGSDSDYVYVPLTPVTAQKLARKLGFTLPTGKIVDLIYRSAQTKLKPNYMHPGKAMTTTTYFLKHSRKIQNQLARSGRSGIIAGHKKDVVLSKRLLKDPSKVAIYGWHKLNGVPTQPLSTIHHKNYVDYSHGIRLIAGTIEIENRELPISFALKDRNYWRLVSKEGTLSTGTETFIADE